MPETAPLTTRATLLAQDLILEDFPQPDIARTLSPNGRAHWAVKRKARLEVIDFVVVHAVRSGLIRMCGLVVMYPVFIYPDRRKRDDDNLATGVLKVCRDILVNGGWLEADDLEHLRQMPVEIRVEKGRRALELRFEVGAC